MQASLAKLDELEAAIQAGELEKAGDILTRIRPMLVGHEAETLLQLKARIDRLTVAVELQKDGHRASLQRLARNRGSVASYERIQNQ